MTKFFDNLQNIIIIALVVVVLVLSTCDRKPNVSVTAPEPVVVTNTITKYDTITNTIVKYIPKIITVIDVDTFPADVDTLEILKDYYRKYVYNDIQNLDSLTLTIHDTISQNKIISRNIAYSMLYPTTTIEKTEYINKREFYFGGEISMSKSQFEYIQADLMLRTKKGTLFGIGAGFNNELKPIVSGKVLYKIGK